MSPAACGPSEGSLQMPNQSPHPARMLATLSRKENGIYPFTSTGPEPTGRSFSIRMPSRFATSV